MKSKVTLFLGFLGIVAFIGTASYLWYLYFIDFNSNGMFGDNDSLNNRLVMIDVSGVNTTNEESKENAENTPSYIFKIENRKKTKTSYTLYIEDMPYNLIDDGCSLETTLSRSDLSYIFKLNGAVIKNGKLDEISNNILDIRNIDANVSNNYDLTVWISEDATDWEGKHYHYRVIVKEVE